MKQWSVIALCTLGISLLVACNSPTHAGDTGQSTGKVFPSPETTSMVNMRVGSTLTPTSPSSIAVETQTDYPTATQSPPAVLPVQICSPLAFQTITELPEIVADPYDPPPPGREERHHGVDFSYYRRKDRLSILGEGIHSVFPGKVAAVVQDKYPYGNMVIIETTQGELPTWLVEELQITAGESLYLLYAHMDKSPLPQLGEVVEACQSLGEVGKSGDFNVEHLHLEARIGPGGTTFKGMAYYDTSTTVEERENYKLWRTSGEYRHFDPMILFSSAFDEYEPTGEN